MKHLPPRESLKVAGNCYISVKHKYPKLYLNLVLEWVYLVTLVTLELQHIYCTKLCSTYTTIDPCWHLVILTWLSVFTHLYTNKLTLVSCLRHCLLHRPIYNISNCTCIWQTAVECQLGWLLSHLVHLHRWSTLP